MNALTSMKPYTLKGVGRSPDEQLFVRVRTNLASGARDVILSVKELQTAPDRAMSQVPGLVSSSTRAHFKRDVEEIILKGDLSFRVATQTGLMRHSFVLPSGEVVGRKRFVCLPEAVQRYGERFRCSGSLQGWKRLAWFAEGNTRLLLALALALSGPVAEFLSVPAPMINLFGAAGTGKTSIGVAAGSVVGGDSRGEFVDSWNSTVNNFEVAAAAHRGTFSVYDETRVSGGIEAILNTIMRLDQGHEKRRMTDLSVNRHFRVPILSTSNHSLCEMAFNAGLPYDEAYSTRMIDVPLPSGALGAFESLHGFSSLAEFCAMMKTLAREHHGVAFRYFVRKLLEEDEEFELAEWLRKIHARYACLARADMPNDMTGSERLRERFATIYTAGSLAHRYGLLPGTRRGLRNALLACERAHVEHVAPFLRAFRSKARPGGQDRVRSSLDRLREHVRTAKLVDLRLGLPRKGEVDHETCPGYINQGASGLEVLFSNSAFVAACGGKREASIAKRQLEEAGMLIRDGRRPSTRRRVWQDDKASRAHVLAVRAEAFGLA